MDKVSSSGGKSTGIIAIILVVIIVLLGAWYGFIYRPAQAEKEKARLEQIAKKEAKKKQEEQEAINKTQYNDFIKEADGAFEQENWKSAQSAYNEASALYPINQYPKDQLTIVNEKLNEIAALEAKSKGTVQNVSSATGRFYVVVSSSIDGDLAMDSATKIASEGNSVKIIEPYGKIKFYRVTLGDYDVLEKAVAAIATISSANGESSWVLKY